MSKWNSNADKAIVLAAADELERQLDKIPPITAGDMSSFDNRRAAVAQMKEQLLSRKTSRPTTCAEDYRGARFVLHGFRATSTTGLDGAIRNWITQVREKAGVQ